MMTILLDSDEDWDSSSASWDAIANDALHAALAHSEWPDLAAGDRHVEVSLALTSDEAVRVLNREWRDKDKPTNVLSFPMAEADEFAGAMPLMLGDIALAHGVCTREAEDKTIPMEQHARHLMVHGMLHLLGYDHQDDASAEEMEGRETRALAALGFPDPYGDKD